MERLTEKHENGIYTLVLPNKQYPDDVELKWAVYARLGKAEDVAGEAIRNKSSYERALEKLDANGRGLSPEANAIRLLLNFCEI